MNMTIDATDEYHCTRCGSRRAVTVNVPSADPWESANLCAACLRAYLDAIDRWMAERRMEQHEG